MESKINILRKYIRANRNGGFTLIEVLLAFAILSIIMGALYSTLFVAHKALEGNEESLLRLHELRTAMDVIRREVEAAKPMQGDYGNFKVSDRDIYGQQASMLEFSTFTSMLPGSSRVEYRVDETADERLVLIKAIYSEYSNEAGREAEMLEEIIEFTVEAKDGSKWVRTWNKGILPTELRVSITVPLKNKNFTLTEIIRTRIGKKA